MVSLNLPFMAKEQGPAWLPAPVAEARKLVYWAQVILLVFGIILIIAGILSIVIGGLFYGIYLLIAGLVYIGMIFVLKVSFFANIEAGRFKDANDKLLFWAIITLILGFLAGVFLLLGYMRMRQIDQPNYQPYPAGQFQAQKDQPPPAPAPKPQPAAPQAQEPEPQPAKPHAEMMKCKKCGVQYPAFMRTCPNCNEPR